MTDSRPRKKARRETEKSSSIFAPFRALGIISTKVPFALQSLSSRDLKRPAFSFVTSTGKSLAIWADEAIRLKFVANVDQEISSLEVVGTTVFVAAGSSISLFVRGDLVGQLQAGSTIKQILILGPHCHALSADGSCLWSWDTDSKELYSTITFPPNFTATSFLHPDTYLNKVVVSSKQGQLAIWNLQTSTCIHTFEASDLLAEGGAITCLAQSPAVDVLAIGFETGHILIFDIKQGQSLFSFKMDLVPVKQFAGGSENRGITSISFRTDNVAHTVATGSSDGNIAIWDLSTDEDGTFPPGRLLHTVKLAHFAPIAKLAFLPGQPILVSNAGDNALRQWIFDSPSGPPRLHRERAGHLGPPTLVRYIGGDGKQLLSAGGPSDRTLRLTSVVRDSRSFELAQAHHKAKHGLESRLPHITAMSFNPARSQDWEDLMTVSAGENVARTWSVQNKKQGDRSFELGLLNANDVKAKRHRKAAGLAKAVCITACGNFALVGHSDCAEVGLWNIQSGVRRKSFIMPDGSSSRSHSVTGIATDALNRTTVVATLSGDLHFFDFHSTQLMNSINLGTGIMLVVLHRDNNLLAMACEDNTVRIVDIDTCRLVRNISAANARILDITLSSDCRWLVAASQDSVIQTFDLPTGKLIDAFRTQSMPVSISFSPTGDFLASAHLDSVGVFLWANRAQFSEISIRSFAKEKEMPLQTLPKVHVEGDDAEAGVEALDDPQSVDQTQLALASTHFDDNLTSLSDQPQSKWQTLLNLDVIRLRNKPVEPPKAPEQAPFFLPTIAGVNHQFDTQPTSAAQPSAENHFGGSSGPFETPLTIALHDEDDIDNAHFAQVLIDLSPTALDLEMRSLSPALLPQFMQALTKRLDLHRDFEAIQAILAVFLRVQVDALLQTEEAASALADLLAAQKRESDRLTSLIGFCQGTLAFLRNVPIV